LAAGCAASEDYARPAAGNRLDDPLGWAATAWAFDQIDAIDQLHSAGFGATRVGDAWEVLGSWHRLAVEGLVLNEERRGIAEQLAEVSLGWVLAQTPDIGLTSRLRLGATLPGSFDQTVTGKLCESPAELVIVDVE
jgi:hypothetical protein